MINITLEPEHQQLLCEALTATLGCKLQEHIIGAKKLGPTRNQYNDAMEKLLQPIPIYRYDKNLFVWILDQLEHGGSYSRTAHAYAARSICHSILNRDYDYLYSDVNKWIYAGARIIDPHATAELL